VESSLQLTIDPLRVQWLRSPTNNPTESREGIPNIGSFPEALDSFSMLIAPWLDICPAIKRLAFGAILLLPTKDHSTGYTQLNDYLHTVQLSPDNSDFMYRINRRRISKCGIPNLQINRLMSWSFLRWEGLMFTIPPEIVPASPEHGGYACRLELDINTSPEFKQALPPNKLKDLWQELTNLGVEIASEGDMP
jgi:hypothetical protein